MEGLRPPQGPEHRGIYATAEVVDWAEIEAEAWQLIAERDQLPQAEVYRQERLDNARTALGEALTASGHLSRIELQATSPEEVHAQVLTRLLNGWDDRIHPHEKHRRFAELCNALIIHRIEQKILTGQLPPTIAFNESSDYPEALPRELAEPIGYRYKNKKGMVRSTYFQWNEDGTFTRVIEQMSRSNGTSPTTFAFLRGAGIRAEGDEPADVLALQTPQLYSLEDYADGVVDIMRRLDQHAGQGIRYGERIGENPLHVPYEIVREVSIKRETQLEFHIKELANYEEKLDALYAEGKISDEARKTLYAEEACQHLRVICVLAPEYARDCFGEAAGELYEEAAMAEAAGQHDVALWILHQAQRVEDPILFCGIGLTPEEAEKLGIATSDLGQLLQESKTSWKWRLGVCRVTVCPTRPAKTQIGPCSVCRRCQAKFDAGKDPTKITFSPAQSKPAAKVVQLFQAASAEKQAA